MKTFPIKVEEIRLSKSEGQYNVMLVQEIENTGSKSILSFTQGTLTSRRVVYIPFKEEIAINLGLISFDDKGELKLNLFDDFNEHLTSKGLESVKLRVVESLIPRTWMKDGVEQSNIKRRGKNGEVCLHKGQPIYRDCVLSYADQEDILLEMDPKGTQVPKAATTAEEMVEIPF